MNFRIFLFLLSMLPTQSLSDIADNTDRFFAVWTEQEAAELLGIYLPKSFECVHYDSDTFPVVCVHGNVNIVLNTSGNRTSEEPPSRLFSTARFDWQVGPTLNDLSVLEMSRGSDAEGFVNCRFWPTFDPFMANFSLFAHCFLQHATGSSSAHNLSVSFNLEVFGEQNEQDVRNIFLATVEVLTADLLRPPRRSQK